MRTSFTFALLAVASGLMVVPGAVPLRPAVRVGPIFMKNRPTMADLREFFKYDVDLSQGIDFGEFLGMQSSEVRWKFGDDQIKAWFDAADSDGNGVIDANEFFAMNSRSVADIPRVGSLRGRRSYPGQQARADLPRPRGPTMDDIREFQKWDVDGSQTIDFGEFLRMQSSEVRRKFSDREIREWFDEADLDGNGVLDANEFFAMNGMLNVVSQRA